MSDILATTYDRTMSITKSDTVDLDHSPGAGLMALKSGTVVFNDLYGTTVSMTVTAGQIIPVPAARIWSTGTTATVRVLTAMPFKKAMSE